MPVKTQFLTVPYIMNSLLPEYSEAVLYEYYKVSTLMKRVAMDNKFILMERDSYALLISIP